jgi:hypothetical protein
MESWRKVWRDGFVPLLSDEALAALETALRADDKRLIQGATTQPPPLICCQDWPCEGGCLVGYCGMAEGLTTVGEVEMFFARVCFEVDTRLGEPAGCRWLLNWWDETPRAEALAEMLEEVEREKSRRAGA